MKKSILLLIAALLSFSTLSFGASLQSLSKQQVLNTLQDKTMTTIHLITMNKQLVDNALTIYFDKQGQVSGQLVNKPDNNPQTDQGTWLVKSNGTLCVTWQSWNQNKPICVYVYKLNNSIAFINLDTNNFESLVLNDEIKTGNQLH